MPSCKRDITAGCTLSFQNSAARLQREQRQSGVRIILLPSHGSDVIHTALHTVILTLLQPLWVHAIKQQKIYRVKMNCARVLNAFSHPQPAVTSAELAKYLTRNKSQYLCQLLNMYPLKSTQHYELPVYSPERINPQSTRRTSSPSPTLAQGPPNLRSCFRKSSTGGNKKRVVFADDRGLELTAVRLFNPETLSCSFDQVKGPPLACLQDQQLSPNNLRRNNLSMGFSQPAQDLTRLRDRRQGQSYISKTTPSGPPGIAPLYDNNKGLNYKVCMEKEGSNDDQGNRFYSTLSKYRPFSCQQAPACSKETDEPQYFRSYLYSRYRPELSPSA